MSECLYLKSIYEGSAEEIFPLMWKEVQKLQALEVEEAVQVF